MDSPKKCGLSLITNSQICLWYRFLRYSSDIRPLSLSFMAPVNQQTLPLQSFISLHCTIKQVSYLGFASGHSRISQHAKQMIVRFTHSLFVYRASQQCCRIIQWPSRKNGLFSFCCSVIPAVYFLPQSHSARLSFDDTSGICVSFLTSSSIAVTYEMRFRLIRGRYIYRRCQALSARGPQKVPSDHGFSLCCRLPIWRTAWEARIRSRLP